METVYAKILKLERACLRNYKNGRVAGAEGVRQRGVEDEIGELAARSCRIVIIYVSSGSHEDLTWKAYSFFKLIKLSLC